MEIKPHDCGRKQSDEAGQGDPARSCWKSGSHFRSSLNPKQHGAHERFAWRHPLQAIPIHDDGTTAEALECRGKDISLNGIGFYVPRDLGTGQARLQLPKTPQTPAMSVPVRIVRMRPRPATAGLRPAAVLLHRASFSKAVQRGDKSTEVSLSPPSFLR